MNSVLQNPSNSQNYNRFSYVLNNPLKYTDPSGYNYSNIDWAYSYGTGNGGHRNWKQELDWIYGRGEHSLGGGFGGLGKFYYVNGRGYQIASDGSLITGNEKDQGTRAFYRNNQYGFYAQTSGSRIYATKNGRTVGVATSDVRCDWVSVGDPLPAWNDRGWRLYGMGRGNGRNNAQGGGGWLTAADMTNNGIGGFGTGMGNLDGSFRLSKGGNLSPKYYASNWTGGSRAQITTYNAAKWGSRISKGSLVVSVGLGAYNINQANIQDGRTFGYNTQVATAQTIGGIGGAMAGAEIGAAIGVWFGGVGAIPGAVIGGVVGGVLGGWGGSELGGAAVDWYY